LDNDLLNSKQLGLLIDHIKKTYTSTAETLVSPFESNEITYDLLWGIFKPNSLVYTTYFGTGKPRCVKYDSSKEKETRDGLKYRNLDCCYLGFDSEEFGEASIQFKIPKFQGTKRINALTAFPLQYHRDLNRVKADLIQCGRKFEPLRGSHYRYCHGPAFFIDEAGRPVQKSINGRVMIDAAFFQEINPDSSSRPHVTKPELLKLGEDELLICCPTVPGFSFGNKLWGKILSF
jgi:hypothetical protein